MSPLPTRTVVLVVALLVLAFFWTGLAHSFDANSWNALATFVAVVVALGFGLREIIIANNSRRTREIIAVAITTPHIIQVKNVLKGVTAQLSSRTEEQPFPWELLHDTSEYVTKTFRELHHSRLDLPEDMAVALSHSESTAANVQDLTKAVADVHGGFGKIPAKLPEHLQRSSSNLADLLRLVLEDLRLAHSIAHPLMTQYREALRQRRPSKELDSF